jgi:hypothetical protein
MDETAKLCIVVPCYNEARPYLGRVAATAISLTLGLQVHDTQCGAKPFRASPSCRALFEAPFVTGWIFDVEILARMIRAHRDRRGPDPRSVVREVPLRAWRDVPGSKVGALDFFRAMRDLWRIRGRYLGPS